MPEMKIPFKTAGLQLFFVYASAHLPIFLLSDARYWDDWSLSGASKDMLISVFTDAGSPLSGYYHYAVQMAGWWLYSFSTFALSYFIVYVFYLILRSLGFSKFDALSLSFLAAVQPFYYARIAAINNAALFFLLIFVFAIYIFVISVKENNRIKEYFSYLLFMFSFQFNSLVPAFLFVLFLGIFLFYKETENSTDESVINRQSKRIKYVMKRTAFIVLIPFIYAIFQHFFFKKSGMFAADYNVINIKFSLITSEIKVILLNLFPFDGIHLEKKLLLLIFVAVMLAIYFIKSDRVCSSRETERSGRGLIGIGVVLLGLGALAYVMVGKEPSYETWPTTRFQILLPFGAAFSTLGLFKVICAVLPAMNSDERHRMKVASFGGLIAVFVVNWWFVYGTFYIDHLRQEAFADTIRNTPALQSRNSVILDRSGLQAFDTPAGLGEYAGLHESATGKRDALILNYDSMIAYGGWSGFVNNFRKFLGAWAKVEDAAFDVPGCLYIIHRGRAGRNKWSYAASAFAVKITYPERYAARHLLSFDGPFCQSSR
ncbi:hypothetical protein NFO65_13175 [Neorhizobium galegae]|uniref:phospholipid carrier-dependent glycosyltransferase n=1 Tax=Neorhizobium galegae TaxID=399 RepID=UPI0021008293|nr:phospholipid carrier-dependent glycosyltransferase [Neorhizobium galegae]MCQ1571684.1 hypothetical protein [Neorhizobium galegae]